jgi:hypothetical protein
VTTTQGIDHPTHDPTVDRERQVADVAQLQLGDVEVRCCSRALRCALPIWSIRLRDDQEPQ